MLLALALHAFLLQTPAADPTLPPPTAHVRYTAQGRGVQVYQCLAQNGGYAWVYQNPEAILIDTTTKAQVGTHSAGPTWTWTDGSAITGKILQKQASPDAASIPWLLLATTPVGTTTGSLSNVTLIRRSNTQAGSAPNTGCDAKAAAESTVLRVPYVATYTFYSDIP
jgi:hypothetical protein